MKFEVELTATKTVIVTLDEKDLQPGEDLLDGAANLAEETAFNNTHKDMVEDRIGWDLTVETVRPIVDE